MRETRRSYQSDDFYQFFKMITLQFINFLIQFLNIVFKFKIQNLKKRQEELTSKMPIKLLNYLINRNVFIELTTIKL